MSNQGLDASSRSSIAAGQGSHIGQPEKKKLIVESDDENEVDGLLEGDEEEDVPASRREPRSKKETAPSKWFKISLDQSASKQQGALLPTSPSSFSSKSSSLGSPRRRESDANDDTLDEELEEGDGRKEEQPEDEDVSSLDLEGYASRASQSRPQDNEVIQWQHNGDLDSRKIDGPEDAESSKVARSRSRSDSPDPLGVIESDTQVVSCPPSPAPRPRSRSRAPSVPSMTDEELANARYANSIRLLTSWEDIVLRYKDLPADEDDEIDLFTGKLVRDRGKLKKMKGTRKFGYFSNFHVGGDSDVEVDEEEEGSGADDGEPEGSRKRSRSRSRSAAPSGAGSVGPSGSRQGSATPTSEAFFRPRARTIDPEDLRAFLAENEVLMRDFVDLKDDFSGIDEVTVYDGETDRESVYGRTDVESGSDAFEDDNDSSGVEEISKVSVASKSKTLRKRKPVAESKAMESEASSSDEEDMIVLEPRQPRRKGKEEVVRPASPISTTRGPRRSIGPRSVKPLSSSKKTSKTEASPSPPPSPSALDAFLLTRPTIPGYPQIAWHRPDDLPLLTDLPLLAPRDIFATDFKYGTSSWTSTSPHVLFDLPRNYDPVPSPLGAPVVVACVDGSGAVVYAPSTQAMMTVAEVQATRTKEAQKRARMKHVEKERKLAERRELERLEREKEKERRKALAAPAKEEEVGAGEGAREEVAVAPPPPVAKLPRHSHNISFFRIPVDGALRARLESPAPGPSSVAGPSRFASVASNPNPPASSAPTFPSSWAAQVASLLQAKATTPAFASPPPQDHIISTSSPPRRPLNIKRCRHCLAFGRTLVASVCPGRRQPHWCTGGDPSVVQPAFPSQCLRCLFQGREDKARTCLGAKLGHVRCVEGGRRLSAVTQRAVVREGKGKGGGGRRMVVEDDDDDDDKGLVGDEEMEEEDGEGTGKVGSEEEYRGGRVGGKRKRASARRTTSMGGGGEGSRKPAKRRTRSLGGARAGIEKEVEEEDEDEDEA